MKAPALNLTKSLPMEPAKANRVAVAPFVKNEELFGVFEKIVNVLIAWWPKKTAACVAHVAHVSERAVQFWLARQTGLSLENVIALLRSDAGFEILEAIMGDSKSEWWLDTKVAAELRASRKLMRIEQRRTARLKELRAQRELLEDQ